MVTGYYDCDLIDNSTTDLAWKTWTSSTCSGSETDTAWLAWTSGTSPSSGNVTVDSGSSVYQAVASPPPTPEQVEARLAQQKKYQEALKERKRKREEADAKALALLVEHLTPEQRDTLDKLALFIVVGQSGKKYKIRKGQSVTELDGDDNPVAHYCIHPTDFPAYDTMLAQMLMLEADEKKFLKIANRTVAWRGR